jgi:hypothetical protein
MSDYKVGQTPSRQSHLETIADYWELLALADTKPKAVLDLVKKMSKASDEIHITGIVDEEDKLSIRIAESHRELEKRAQFLGNKYPFVINDQSLSAQIDFGNQHHVTYIYLLLCTRLNMQLNRTQAGIDGTEIFEHVCALVATEYFGAGTESKVFGTGDRLADMETKGDEDVNDPNFENKVEAMVVDLNEGQGFRNFNDSPPTEKDGGIDIYCWKDFYNYRPGKMVAFGQCKTGTTWRNIITSHKLLNFHDYWLQRTLCADPIHIGFISDNLIRAKNVALDQARMILFDRLRIMQFSPNLSEPLSEQLISWTNAALDFARAKLN